MRRAGWRRSLKRRVGVAVNDGSSSEVDVNNGQFADNAALHANWTGACSDCDSALDIPNTTPGGLASVSGAAQSTQISGDDNDVVEGYPSAAR